MDAMNLRLIFVLTDLIAPLAVGYYLHQRHLVSGESINKLIRFNLVCIYFNFFSRFSIFQSLSLKECGHRYFKRFLSDGIRTKRKALVILFIVLRKESFNNAALTCTIRACQGNILNFLILKRPVKGFYVFVAVFYIINWCQISILKITHQFHLFFYMSILLKNFFNFFNSAFISICLFNCFSFRIFACKLSICF